MMHYRKGKNVEELLTVEKVPIDNLPKDLLWMKVNGGTKLTNVVDYATKAVKSGEHRNVLWTGSGAGGITKTVSCAEIMKRDFEMHQITRIKYSLTEEDWDPQTDGLDPIVVKRYIPTIFIFLSLDEIDAKELGYQRSKGQTGMWLDRPRTGDKRPANGQQHNGNRGGGGGGVGANRSSANNGRPTTSGNSNRGGGVGGARGSSGRGGNNSKTPNRPHNRKPQGDGANASKTMKTDVPQ